MSYRSGVLTGVLGSLFCGSVCAAAWWVANSATPAVKAEKPAPPATVAKVLKEDEINVVKLTPEAEQRIGIETAAVERRSIRQSRTYGGEVMVPLGQSVLVAAPLGGELQVTDKGLPRPGARVRKGQPILLLFPLLTPEARTTLAAARVDAEGQIKNARTQVEGTRIAFQRAKKLLRDDVGSQRNVDETEAQHEFAQKTLEAAEARRDLLVKALGEFDKGTGAPLTIEAPTDGLLRALNAQPGQAVPAGAALFEIVDLSRVWVRVPIYVGDEFELRTDEAAEVVPLTARPGSTWLSEVAKPVDAPPSANANAGTVDAYYEVENSHGRLIPGERVGVVVPLVNEANSLILPWSTVIHDIHGGTWVYVAVAERTYSRQRVVVRFIRDSLAVLDNGPAVGKKVVTAGAAELFGTEIGFSK